MRPLILKFHVTLLPLPEPRKAENEDESEYW